MSFVGTSIARVGAADVAAGGGGCGGGATGAVWWLRSNDAIRLLQSGVDWADSADTEPAK